MAQDRARSYVDPQCRKLEFAEGERVYLRVPESLNTLKTCKCPNLSPRYFGPFLTLKRIGELAYKLALLEECRVHPVFHVSRL